MICWVSEVLIFIEDIIEQSDYSLEFYQLVLVRSNIYNFAHRPEADVKEGGVSFRDYLGGLFCNTMR